MKRQVTTALILIAALALPTAADAATLTLNTALQRVRENSPRLRQARETLQAAEARTEGSRSGWYPHLSAVADYSYRGLVSEYEGIKFMPNNSYNARVGAEMTLLDFGRTAKGVAIARSGEKAADLSLSLTGRDLAYATIQVFHTMLFLREAVAVKRKEIAALEKNLEYTRTRYREGVATRFDLLSTEVRLASAMTKKTDLETELANQSIALGRLCGIPEGEPVAVEGSFGATEQKREESAVVASALEKRLELQLAGEHERTATKRTELAERAGLPIITGSASWGTGNGFLPDLEEMRPNTAAGMRMELPLFTGFRSRSEKREALAMQRAAGAERLEGEQRVQEEVRQSLNSLKASRQNIATTTLQVEQAELAATHARTRYRNGLATALDLLDTEASLAGAELSNLQARYTFVMNTYALKRAAGEPLEPIQQPDQITP
ncbi:MAG: TolC family protein [Candidatus Chlorobium antarcticum]|nr:TolC family protein [Candidatus Chlorobium antarcticum]